MKTTIFIIILLFAVNLTFAQKSKVADYKIRAAKRAVTITFKGKARWLDVRKQIDAARITDTELMFANEKAGFRYLVIDITGDSRDSDFDRQCGAGTESNLIWLKLDAAWKILDVKSVRYQSCWSGTDLNEPFTRTQNSLNVDFADSRENMSVKLTYNADEPEKGFQTVGESIKIQ
ncbi:MAG TPA: hypothetical protein VGC97_05435 [Pyrinomonadaceae bacterium]|jgi:hypothetical protein